MLINYAGSIVLSTVDWPGKAVSMIFLRGCPLRCPYCINAEMRIGEDYRDIDLYDILDPKSIDFISGIVISGGEPLMQPEVVKLLAQQAHEIDLEVAIETSGYYPEVLEDLLWSIDTVFLDIKEVFGNERYVDATQVLGTWPKVFKSLELCLQRGIPFETRTTVFRLPGYKLPTKIELKEIKDTIQILVNAYPQSRYIGQKIQTGILPEDFYGAGKKATKGKPKITSRGKKGISNKVRKVPKSIHKNVQKAQ